MIKPGNTDKCPHCQTANRFEYATFWSNNTTMSEDITLNESVGSTAHLKTCRCTNCLRNIIFFKEQMIYPLGSSRIQAPKEVPTGIAEDFNEACLVQPLSEKAASALTRRCLQNMLHEQGIKDKNLDLEIEMAMKNLPSHLSDAIDAIRTIGNFAAHPIKSTNTGEIIDVEAGEVEWNLDTLEQLFDFYYVGPAKLKMKREKLNVKLKEAGKPALKTKVI